MSTSYALRGRSGYSLAHSTYWMAGLAQDAAHFFKFLFILVLYTLAMTLFVSSSARSYNQHLVADASWPRISSSHAYSATAASRSSCPR